MRAPSSEGLIHSSVPERVVLLRVRCSCRCSPTHCASSALPSRRIRPSACFQARRTVLAAYAGSARITQALPSIFRSWWPTGSTSCTLETCTLVTRFSLLAIHHAPSIWFVRHRTVTEPCRDSGQSRAIHYVRIGRYARRPERGTSPVVASELATKCTVQELGRSPVQVSRFVTSPPYRAI
jgi:hypothetical protein